MLNRFNFYINDFDRVKDYRAEYPEAGKIFNYPTSFWLGTRKNKKRRQAANVHKRVVRLMKRVAPAEPVLVIYNLPDRDMGNHSKGGAADDKEYLEFIHAVASGIGSRKPILIFEPDAIPHSTMMTQAQRKKRLSLMKKAIKILTEESSALIYIDIGHSNWLSAEEAGTLFNQVYVEGVSGYSINVSNFRTNKESMRWGGQVGDYALVSNFVVDTSRNGNGPYGNNWCNPPGRCLGTAPTLNTHNENCDAFLWIKVPGESDGTCNNGPRAGRFWPEYARELVRNTSWL